MGLLGRIHDCRRVALLGQFHTMLPESCFCTVCPSIGIAFLLVQITLELRPALPEEVRQTVQASYASTTLNNVDCEAVLNQLTLLMQGDRLYADSDLSLRVFREAGPEHAPTV